MKNKINLVLSLFIGATSFGVFSSDFDASLLLEKAKSNNQTLETIVTTPSLYQITPTPIVEYQYEIKKGTQYSLCQDLVPYLHKSDAAGGGTVNAIFIVDDEKFSPINWKSQTEYLGIKISMQLLAFNPRSIDGFMGWKKSIESIEARLKNDYRVATAELDLNNNGALDKVLAISSLSKNGQYRVTGNFPVSQFYNLAIDWYEKERPSSIIGELFLYQGRTFLIQSQIVKYGDEIHKEITVNEPKTNVMRKSGGISITPEVCLFESI